MNTNSQLLLRAELALMSPGLDIVNALVARHIAARIVIDPKATTTNRSTFVSIAIDGAPAHVKDPTKLAEELLADILTRFNASRKEKVVSDGLRLSLEKAKQVAAPAENGEAPATEEPRATRKRRS